MTDDTISQELIMKFLHACDIVSLSSSVEETLAPEMMVSECPPVQRYFHFIVPCAQRYLYDREPDLYEELKEQGVASKLHSMVFSTVGKLEIAYSLSTPPEVTVKEQVSLYLTKIEQMFCYFACIFVNIWKLR